MPTIAEYDNAPCCAGCHTPMTANWKRDSSGEYHKNCVPSHSESMDAEYYQGIREGYDYSRRQQARREAEAAEDRADAYGRRQATPESERANAPARELSRDDCAVEYRAIRERMVASYEVDVANNAAFDAAVKARLAKKGVASPTPQQFVAVARGLRFTCRRCAGTGAFITYVENGVPKGPGGACFRCNGKGSQNDADTRRNFGHGMHYVPPGVC